jgi:CBS domain-containing protein
MDRLAREVSVYGRRWRTPLVDLAARLLAGAKVRWDASAMLIRHVMTANPIRIAPGASLHEAAETFAESEASVLMVADGNGRLVGVLSEGDLIRAMLPDLEAIRGAGSSLLDALRVFVEHGAQLAASSITPYLIMQPITVAPSDHVAQVATILMQRMIRRLPVVDDGILVGTVSRSDVCRAVLRAKTTLQTSTAGEG